ncbi:hypothetical protein [Kitasatospora brasiliensis]|uniref:hypothetical protein n=1 Tax=Kitasatospora brasiliensis TaxID=3058040 RepID=UPI002931C44C|nr:hypothetical protein [Kitasatospora sp. K002]
MARKKKPKRPLAQGAIPPPKPVRRRSPRDLTPRTVRRTAWLVGLPAPLLMLGPVLLASNPDYQVPCMITAVLVLMAGVIGIGFVRTRGWVIASAVLVGVLLMVVPTSALQAQLISHRGVRTEVEITAAHSSKGKNGVLSWSCDIRRVDGQPLRHARYAGYGCSSRASVGNTAEVLVDPQGWAPPASAYDDFSLSGAGLYVSGALPALWGLLTLAAARLTLREAGAWGRQGRGR